MSVFQQRHGGALAALPDLLVATADSGDALLDSSVVEVLRAVRDKLALDVVFVSEFVDGRRVFRFAESNARGPALQPGASDPLEASYCQRVVDGRMPGLAADVAALPASVEVPATPFRVGAYLSTPITLKDGRTFGTLCCFSTSPNPMLQGSDLQLLRQCAALVAKKLELADARGIKEPPPEWQLEPIDTYESKVWKLR